MTALRTLTKLLGIFVAACALACTCALGWATTAHAQEQQPVNWTVTYDANKQMVSNYDKAAVNEKLSNMQPGDSFTLNITLSNKSAASTDWYMTSEALKTLEEASSASGGAYTYKLVYNGDVIYSSELVGGDEAEGFKEISGATGKWFFLGPIESGSTGRVSVEMALDGETQNNAYMRTDGRLNFVFAVEDSEGTVTTSGEPGTTLVKTADPLLLALYAIGIVAAVACFAFCLVSLRKFRKGRDAK